MLSSCSANEPFQDLNVDGSGSSEDSTLVESPIDTLVYPAYPLPAVEFRNLSSVGHSNTFTPDSLVAGPYADFDVYQNAERVPWPFNQGRWLRFEGERSIVEVSIDCSELPFLNLKSLFLLEVPDSVDVDQWMRYKNADFGNEYTSIKADTVFAVAAAVDSPTRVLSYRLSDPITNPRYIFELRYALSISQLTFENGIGVEQLVTEEHECFPGDGWGLEPPSD